MDLVRLILLEAEKFPPLRVMNIRKIEGYDIPTIVAHIDIMNDAGLVEAVIQTGGFGSGRAIINKITWEGHEFLRLSRDSTVWQRAKKEMIDTGKAWSFELLKELLIRLASSA